MNNKRISKRIFYVWGANEKKRRDVELCIMTWREKCHEYEIIEINEDSVKYFDFQKELKNNLWFKTVYENKMYAYIADYIRIKVLYDNGGIYLDTDVSTLKNFDEFLNNSAFVGIQNDSKTNVNVLEPAILGAEKNNIILKRIIDFYDKEIWQKPIYNMPQIFQYVLEKEYNRKIIAPNKEEQEIIDLPDITLYPEKYFIPFRAGVDYAPECVENETTTIHWFGASWVKENILYFLKNKHRENIKQLIKKCFSEKNIIDNPFLKIKKLYKKYNIEIDFSYLFKFKHKYYGKQRYLTVFILGFQIKLWRR